MLAEKYIQEKRRQERKKGREEERKAWTAWNQRRVEAEQAGVAFAEPPPGASGQR